MLANSMILPFLRCREDTTTVVRKALVHRSDFRLFLEVVVVLLEKMHGQKLRGGEVPLAYGTDVARWNFLQCLLNSFSVKNSAMQPSIPQTKGSPPCSSGLPIIPASASTKNHFDVKPGSSSILCMKASSAVLFIPIRFKYE